MCPYFRHNLRFTWGFSQSSMYLYQLFHCHFWRQQLTSSHLLRKSLKYLTLNNMLLLQAQNSKLSWVSSQVLPTLKSQPVLLKLSFPTSLYPRNLTGGNTMLSQRLRTKGCVDPAGLSPQLETLKEYMLPKRKSLSLYLNKVNLYQPFDEKISLILMVSFKSAQIAFQNTQIWGGFLLPRAKMIFSTLQYEAPEVHSLIRSMLFFSPY